MKYENAYLNKVMNDKSQHLPEDQQENLLRLLPKPDYFLWYFRYVGNRPNIFRIERRHQTSLLKSVPHTKVTRINIQELNVTSGFNRVL